MKKLIGDLFWGGGLLVTIAIVLFSLAASIALPVVLIWAIVRLVQHFVG